MEAPNIIRFSSELREFMLEIDRALQVDGGVFTKNIAALEKFKQLFSVRRPKIDPRIAGHIERGIQFGLNYWINKIDSNTRLKDLNNATIAQYQGSPQNSEKIVR